MSKIYSVKSPLHITANIVASGIPGKNGLTPYVGENGNWWVGDVDTNISASGGDHPALTGRDKPDQHPIEAITELREELNQIPAPMSAGDLRKILWNGGHENA